MLLILAGVSLNAVFSQEGIFKRAEQATDVYSQAKAREILEIALSDAQVQKYTEGLTDEQLTDRINEVGEEIEERETQDISQAIVEGYIFSIDRTVPKILDYIGPANGVIITATVSGNDGWVKQGEGKVTVEGTIKTYSGGTITSISATKDSASISDFSIDEKGRYTINNITEDTTIVINGADSNGKENSKVINVQVKVDRIAPTVDELIVRVEENNIKISAKGTDNESGIDYFTYTITSTNDSSLLGIPEDKRNGGNFKPNETIEIKATKDAIYKIKVVSVDKVGNITSDTMAKTEEVTIHIPKTIETIIDESIGKFFLYPTKEGKKILCMSVAANEQEKTIDIVSLESLGKITLGGQAGNTTWEGYNAVYEQITSLKETLSTIIENYVNYDISNSFRTFGKPNDSLGLQDYIDNPPASDADTLVSILNSSNWYKNDFPVFLCGLGKNWTAGNDENTSVQKVYFTGGIGTLTKERVDLLHNSYFDGQVIKGNPTLDVTGVFNLKSDLTISKGKGTADEPFEFLGY